MSRFHSFDGAAQRRGVSLEIESPALSTMKRNWRKFFERLFLAAAIAFVVAVAPLPFWTPNWFLYWQVPTAVFVFIVYIGKLLIDTILFPRKK